ncbi:sugar transferase, partial [Thermodesulfobacteriota bacterium]
DSAPFALEDVPVLRILRVGGFLRDSKLDELPQLFNVLKGEMSLVGPRAEDPKYRHVFEGERGRVLEMPPGMTGLSWVELRAFHEENIDAGEDWERHYLEISLPRKIEVDLEYVKKYSMFLDLRILFRTFAGLLTRSGSEMGEGRAE